MTRVWYNKSFSFVYAAINLIKKQDVNQEFYLVASHTKLMLVPYWLLMKPI
jgi:hypothetical protein